MSEEQKADPSGIHEHYREHPGCDKWGGLGYSRMREAPRWFCHEHKAEGERHIGKA